VLVAGLLVLLLLGMLMLWFHEHPRRCSCQRQCGCGPRARYTHEPAGLAPRWEWRGQPAGLHTEQRAELSPSPVRPLSDIRRPEHYPGRGPDDFYAAAGPEKRESWCCRAGPPRPSPPRRVPADPHRPATRRVCGPGRLGSVCSRDGPVALVTMATLWLHLFFALLTLPILLLVAVVIAGSVVTVRGDR
jgi:hypothetical protein